MRRWPLLAVLLIVGCASIDPRPLVEVRSGVVSDAELKATGEWTKRDALARALLDLEAPPHLRGRYPVRLVPLRRKLLMEVCVGGLTIPLPRVGGLQGVGFNDGEGDGGGGVAAPLELLQALLGLDYERRYQYVAALGCYVLLDRGAPPTILGADPARPHPALPGRDAPREALRALRAELERDLERIHEAAARVRPDPAP